MSQKLILDAKAQNLALYVAHQPRCRTEKSNNEGDCEVSWRS